MSVSERCSCLYGQVAVVYSSITCAIKVIFQHRLWNYFCCVYICQISASGYPKASIDHPQINRYHYNYFLKIMFTSQSRKSRSEKLQSFQSKTQLMTLHKKIILHFPGGLPLMPTMYVISHCRSLKFDSYSPVW